MWTRLLALGLCCLAMHACNEWTPVARRVQPERVLSGPARVEVLLDSAGRYALVTRFDGDDASLHIVDWVNGRSCALPGEVARFERALLGPTESRGESPRFFLPIALRDGDREVLRFVDEQCELHGDYGPVSSTTSRFALDQDGREVLFYGNGMGTVALADPWADTNQVLANQVRSFALVARVSTTREAQLLWLIEDGKLTQRALDGTLVLSLGEAVTGFTQGIFDSLRVAYVDRGDLYEAKAPDFTPVLIADNACAPAYRGTALELWDPCEEQQLVRVGLYTGEIETFAEGVFSSYTDASVVVEYARGPDGSTRLFVEPPGRTRTEVVPAFLGRPLVLDPTRLAGIVRCEDLTPDINRSCDENDRTFVIWSAGAQPLRLYEKVAELVPFVDVRASGYVWLMHHDVSEGRGTLSTFSERSLTPDTVGKGTPLRFPLQFDRATRGYAIEFLPAYPEPLIVFLSEAEPLARDARVFRGTLSARLLSGSLGSLIDDDVTSYAVVGTPLPGLLYGIEEGDSAGLWFAAL